MIPRVVNMEIREILSDFPALMLTGPRQVGKSTIALAIPDLVSRPVIHLDLEIEADKQALLRNPQAYLASFADHCVVIDEAQLLPELFGWLRPLIDAHRVPGRFVLTGSVNPQLVKGVSESLAGRIIYLEIGQINLAEATDAGIEMSVHWFRGGFPDALLAKSGKAWHRWSRSFLDTYIQRDLNLLSGIDLNPETTRKLWSMLAHLNGEQENAESIGRSLGITGTTVKRYLDFLQGAYMIRRLPAWFTNSKKRLVKSPKLYLRTTGLLHFLLNIPDLKSLYHHPAIGASWESYVIEQIYQLKPAHTDLHYYRTHNGAEADLVITSGIEPLACIEIKLSDAPAISRGFHECIADLETPRNYVITPGSRTWKTKEHIEVTSLAAFLNTLREW